MKAVLVMRSSCGAERVFPVRTPRTLIGRESRCHVRIALPSVAKRHCELHVADGSVHVSDLSSESGTFINGRRIQRAELSHEDKLTIGPVTFTVRLNASEIGTSPRSESARVKESKPITQPSRSAAEQDAPEPEIVSFKSRVAGRPAASGSGSGSRPENASSQRAQSHNADADRDSRDEPHST